MIFVSKMKFFRFRNQNSFVQKKSSLLYSIDQHSDTISWNSELSDHQNKLVPLVNFNR
jgi:hypothetical protein